jgi:hypothetical protein
MHWLSLLRSHLYHCFGVSHHHICSSCVNEIGAGDVGLPIREIKDNLEFYVRLSQNHECILLLDNGDALVSFNSRDNLYLSRINSGKSAKPW